MNAQANLPAERKPQIVAGAPVAALVPQTLEEAFRLAGALAASGLAPASMSRPEQIMVAIMAGAELGLAPFQSVQSFAVINGRPTLWGDSLMAVVRARGVKVKEWIDGDGDGLTAHCLVTRPDTGEEIAREFTVAEAKHAKLWGKVGANGKPTPWVTHPRRMLQMRARAFALRDGCADMLRGVQVREEVEDYQHVRDVTPKGAGLRERLAGPSGEGFTAAQAETDEPVDFVEHAAEVKAVVEEIEAEQAEAAREPDQEEAPDEQTDLASDFPGDRQASEFDAVAWAADINRSSDAFETVAELNAFTDAPENKEKFAALEKASPGIARSLAAAINGRRKALEDRERG